MSDSTTSKVYELSRASARGLEPRPRCSNCRAELELDPDTVGMLGPGERGYRCPDCHGSEVFYSAAWLDDQRGGAV